MGLGFGPKGYVDEVPLVARMHAGRPVPQLEIWSDIVPAWSVTHSKQKKPSGGCGQVSVVVFYRHQYQCL
jgi:hypothetical protein